MTTKARIGAHLVSLVLILSSLMLMRANAHEPPTPASPTTYTFLGSAAEDPAPDKTRGTWATSHRR